MPTETNKKLALIGYGKMGRLIEQLSPQFGFDVVLRLDAPENEHGEAIMAHGPGKFITIRKKMRLPARCCTWCRQ
jgi:phosphoglycerate dehydrogenase-like enzyme